MTDNAWNEPQQGSHDQKPANDATGKEWKLIEQLLMSQTKEAKRGRRWGIFFKLMTFVYLFAILLLFAPRLTWTRQKVLVPAILPWLRFRA